VTETQGCEQLAQGCHVAEPDRELFPRLGLPLSSSLLFQYSIKYLIEYSSIE